MRLLKMRIKLLSGSAIALWALISALAAPGDLDFSFKLKQFSGYRVYSINPQQDGRLYVGGEIYSFEGVTMNSLARLKWDGSLDRTFVTGTGPNLRVYAIGVQSNGQVIIGGDFTHYNGQAQRGLARLDFNGLLDRSFAPNINDSVLAIAVQSDNKLVLGGNFATINGQACRGLARLLPDGSLDESFNLGSGLAPNLWASVSAIILQPDNKILVGGYFTNINHNARYSVARLHLDGQVDPSFDAGYIDAASIKCLALQSDGKILLGGTFHYVGGKSRNLIARLNSDGSLDPSFDPGTGAQGNSFPFVNGIAVQNDGKIVIVGGFTSVCDQKRWGTARLYPDGRLDPDFIADTYGRYGGIVDSVAVQEDGHILIGGYFGSVNNSSQTALARLIGDPILRTGIVGSIKSGEWRILAHGAVSPVAVLESTTDFQLWNRLQTSTNLGYETEFTIPLESAQSIKIFRVKNMGAP